ncbi:MAG: universal stress protein [Planctomycetota bacterium]|nr:universal stress protein [Planctomycetota bacterium]
MKVPFDCVLCPTDASETGNLAVPLAYHLVANGGTVHLLHVCEPPRFGNPLYEQYVHGYVPTEEEQQQGLERVKQELHKLPPKAAGDRGVRTEYHLVEGINVGNVIESEAKRLEADVVVLGTHGRTGLSRLLMGSVATDVVNKQNLPVILVHQDGIVT